MTAALTRRTEALSDEILTGTRTPAATAAGATSARGASRQHVSDVSSHLPAALAGVLDTIGVGFVTRWVRRQGALRRRFNPYIAGAPVFDDNMFFGRDPAFTREEAEALVKNPVAGVFRYQPEAAERILELSRLRP